ncbi:hypothetical protein FNE76_07615 [Helicobacter mehlei]|uniref:Holin n=2 Tax=Helicobacter mehlei TaxID=2316080 RepID=A0A553UIT6_9HELI|nr:hypothetical protein FNE76_07615 [Helicobacter mehlei]
MMNTHLEEMLELIPIALVGLLAGGLNYFNNAEQSARNALVVVLTSSFLCICAFGILSATDLPYLAKVGVSAAIGYLGLDNALEVVKKILGLRK